MEVRAALLSSVKCTVACAGLCELAAAGPRRAVSLDGILLEAARRHNSIPIYNNPGSNRGRAPAKLFSYTISITHAHLALRPNGSWSVNEDTCLYDVDRPQNTGQTRLTILQTPRRAHTPTGVPSPMPSGSRPRCSHVRAPGRHHRLGPDTSLIFLEQG